MARAEEFALRNVSRDEGTLADDSHAILKTLQDDNTTVVFPQVMKEIESDLRNIVSMLDAKQTDSLPQAMQAEVERNLQELVASLQKEAVQRSKTQTQ